MVCKYSFTTRGLDAHDLDLRSYCTHRFIHKCRFVAAIQDFSNGNGQRIVLSDFVEDQHNIELWCPQALPGRQYIHPNRWRKMEERNVAGASLSVDYKAMNFPLLLL